MQLNLQQNTHHPVQEFQKRLEDSSELLRYIKGENPKMPRLKREQQREIVLLTNLGFQNYEIQYLMHLKNKENRGKKWRR
jgi:hypothetical protein